MSTKRSIEGVSNNNEYSKESLLQLSIAELKELCEEHNVKISGGIDKEELAGELADKIAQAIKEGIPVKRRKIELRRDCPYLDTVNRKRLDFDFEKLCSVTLSNQNVYACLVCGHYFQGRGIHSPAYVHALQESHHVFINLQTEKFYCLPDNYEIVESSLNDIKQMVNPQYSNQDIEKLDSNVATVETPTGSTYTPGYMGLDNLNCTDFINVVIQALAHVPPLRNFFIRRQALSKGALAQTFGELIRKMYSRYNPKAHVSPHEFVQAIAIASTNKFKIGQTSDPVEFMHFLLNTLHVQTGGTKAPGSSIIHKVFQGEVEITSLDDNEFVKETKKTNFLSLGLDMPPAPLFKDSIEQSILPQVPIFNLLGKYDGTTITHSIKAGMQKFRITKLPDYLIIYFKRFTKNNWFVEKNPTIVTSPMRIDMKPYVVEPAPADCQYNLIANICHQGQPESGTYFIHLLQRGTKQWLQIQDQIVTSVMPDLVRISESYVQVYERVQ